MHVVVSGGNRDGELPSGFFGEDGTPGNRLAPVSDTEEKVSRRNKAGSNTTLRETLNRIFGMLFANPNVSFRWHYSVDPITGLMKFWITGAGFQTDFTCFRLDFFECSGEHVSRHSLDNRHIIYYQEHVSRHSLDNRHIIYCVYTNPGDAENEESAGAMRNALLFAVCERTLYFSGVFEPLGPAHRDQKAKVFGLVSSILNSDTKHGDAVNAVNELLSCSSDELNSQQPSTQAMLAIVLRQYLLNTQTELMKFSVLMVLEIISKKCDNWQLVHLLNCEPMETHGTPLASLVQIYFKCAKYNIQRAREIEKEQEFIIHKNELVTLIISRTVGRFIDVGVEFFERDPISGKRRLWDPRTE